MWHYKNTPGIEILQASTPHWQRLCVELPAITEVGLGTTVAAEGLAIVKRLILTAPSWETTLVIHTMEDQLKH